MTDYDELFPVTPREAAALAAVDRRGAAAATALTVALAERPLPGTLDRGPAPGAGEDADLPVYPSPANPARASRRRWLLAAAVALAVVAAAGSVVALTDDEPPPVTSGGGERLLPGWLPDGLAPSSAVDTKGVADLAPDGRVVVYGADPDAPWAGPLLAVAESSAQWEPPGVSGDAEVTVGGRPGTLRTTGNTVTVAVDDGGRLLIVVGHGLREEAVLAAAEVATGGPSGPSIGAAALPAGFGEVARGPLSATFSLLPGYEYGGPSMGPDTLAVSWIDPPNGRSVGLVQQPGTPADAAFVRLAQPDAATVEVRGREGILLTWQAPEGPAPERVLRWWEPSGTLVTLVSVGLSDDELLRVAEGLRPATGDEVEALVEGHPTAEKDIAAGSGFDLATGNQLGQDWALTLSEKSDRVELVLRWGEASSTVGWDRAEGPGDLLIGSSIPAGWPAPAVYGVVSGEVATVTVEVSGQPPEELELHGTAVDDSDLGAFVAFVDEGIGEVTVVARNADGEEVARDQEVVGPLPFNPTT
jgi:hypothetical protein